MGIGTFIRSGIASGGVIGITPFLTDPVGEDVFLRLAFSVGKTPDTGLQMLWVTGRLDACMATTGNYAAGGGLRLDLCAGADGGATFISAGSGDNAQPRSAQSPPYLDFGPSADLRAELGDAAALTLRFGIGLNVARDSFTDGSGNLTSPPLVALHFELDLSWMLPGRRQAGEPTLARGRTPASERDRGSLR